MSAINELHPVVYSVARRVQQRYPRTVHSYADEAWRWVAAHPERLARALEEDPLGSAWSRLERAIERFLERVGRAERAAAGGYRVDDETYYPLSLIEMALPAVWDITHLSDDAESESNEDGKTHLPPKRVQDPAEGGNWLATIVDVRAAFDAALLVKGTQQMVRRCYADGWSLERIARHAACGADDVDHQIQSALRKIQRQLGGERPTACSPSCECGGAF